MRTKGFMSSFFITAVIILAFANAAFASQDIISIKVKEAPVLDGSDSDKAWAQAKTYTVKDARLNVPITIKSVHTEDMVFFLVSYPDATEDILHKPWAWNKEMEMYMPSSLGEDTFNFRWNMESKDVDLSSFSDDNYTADLWYWKANRSNPAGYADDKYDVLSSLKAKKSQDIISKTGKNRYLLREADEGKECYEEIIPIEFRGDTISQFIKRVPEGSRADIKAKGVWKNKTWTIELGRKLNTGHNDDVQFDINSGKKYLFGISIKSLYGEPIDDSKQNIYGQGRISEPLHLIFK